jgi:hypothetical protein
MQAMVYGAVFCAGHIDFPCKVVMAVIGATCPWKKQKTW